MAKKLSKYDMARQIRDLTISPEEGMDIWAPKIIAVFQGKADLFMEFDNNPSDVDAYCDRRFGLVRTVRNSPIWGPVLFAAINQRPVRKR